jgi:hypothetical protein
MTVLGPRREGLSAEPDARPPVIIVDSNGYAFYRDPRGGSILSADRYSVRLVTDTAKVNQATGAELDSVVGVRGDDHARACEAVHDLRAPPNGHLFELSPHSQSREGTCAEGSRQCAASS